MTEEINDDNPGRRKKPRTEDSGLQIFENDGSASLYALYSCDLGEKLISYASTSDLCKLDLINSQFREMMSKTWWKKAYERFGLKTGKDGWRMGTSLLREPVFIHIDRHPTHGGLYFAGSPQVTSNGNLIAVETDDEQEYEHNAPVGFNLFDATDLTYLGPRRGGGWKTTIAGQDGNRLFISMEQNYLRFSRGDICLRRQFMNNKSPDEIPLIASKTHVIFVIADNIHLLKIVSSDNLVESCQVKELQIGAPQREDEYYQSAIAWGADQSEFVVYNSIRRRGLGDFDYHGTKIFAFSLDAEAHTITQSQAFETDIGLNGDIAMGEDFIAGSCELKKIHVWNRRTTQKTQSSLCDVEDEDDELSIDDIIYPIRMVCHGHMLVTTSHLGAALCIWNMKTGQLMKRYNHADDERFVDMLPDGSDATSLAYSEPLNCHLCMCGYINAWAFPKNSEQARIALLAREREEEGRQRS